MTENEIRKAGQCEDGSSCFDDSENNLFDKKAYNSRVARQPLILGPGIERFLDGKVPLSPLSRSAVQEEAFEGSHLDLNSTSTQSAFHQGGHQEKPLPQTRKQYSRKQYSNNEHFAGDHCRKIITVIGFNDWIHKHILSRIVASGYSVRSVFLQQKRTKNDQRANKILDSLSTRSIESQITSHYLLSSDGTIDYKKFEKVLENASVIIDNISAINVDGDENSYPVLSFLSNFMQNTTNRGVKLVIGLSNPSQNNRTTIALRKELICNARLQEANVILISHGALLGPLHHDSVQPQFNCVIQEYYEKTGIPNLLNDCQNGVHLHDKSISPVDIRDVSKAYLRIIECSEISDGHYHIARPLISMGYLHRTLLIHKKDIKGSLLSEKLLGNIASLFEHFLKMLKWNSEESKSRLGIENLSKLGIKLRPLSKTLRITFNEYHFYSNFCSKIGHPKTPNTIMGYLVRVSELCNTIPKKILQFLSPSGSV